MLYHNENEADGKQQVLTAVHNYVPECIQHGVVADQVSVRHRINDLSNGFTQTAKLEGVHLEIADWHPSQYILEVSKM